jgi:protein-S-isoprenylcysteine O-methyltransferase Ste14
MHWLELKIPPVLVWLVVAGAMLGASYSAPSLSFTRTGSGTIALGLVALALVVTGGVYRISRNPMYLGFLLALAGWAVYLSNAAAAGLLPAFVAYMTQFQIKPEERALLAKFGSEFAQYTSRVRRWI